MISFYLGDLTTGCATSAPLYRLAGQDVRSTQPLAEMVSFELPGSGHHFCPIEPGTANKLLYQGSGWIGGKWRKIESWSASPGFWLKVAGASDFYISGDGQAVVQAINAHEIPAKAPLTHLSGINRDILLGPALVLALALQEIWCLHASAVVFKGQVIAILGESGQGKSTLAAYLGTRSVQPDWKLAADDILPVSQDSNGTVARPYFPQLKLPARAQPSTGLPEQLPLARVFISTKAPLDTPAAIQPISPRQSAQALIRHTVAARLFDPPLLQEHLFACAAMTNHIPVSRLVYPHQREVLPYVQELLENL